MAIYSGRYIIGLEDVERHADTFRLTFYLEIPDMKNPQGEVWKVRFCCNLHENPDAIDLVGREQLRAITFSSKC